MTDPRTPTDRLRECLAADDYAAFDARWSRFGRAVWLAAQIHRERRAQTVTLPAPLAERERA